MQTFYPHNLVKSQKFKPNFYKLQTLYYKL